jgi:hypothetical protein
MKKLVVFGSIFFVLILLVNACKHEPKLEGVSNNGGNNNGNNNPSTCDTFGVTYTKQASTVINTYCVHCHNNISASGGVNLEGYSNAKNATLNGNVVGTIINGNMPKGGTPLNACNKRKIQLWAAAGCPQ